jgi:hypothetical protein
MTADVRAAPLVRPWWQGARVWLGLAAVVVIGAVLVGTLSEQPGRPLDPSSTHGDGSKALVRLLAHYGTSVTSTSSTATALRSDVVVVTAPDDYATEQLREMARAGRHLVLVQPGARALTALGSDAQPDRQVPPAGSPNCADPGAQAAGDVAFPSDTVSYSAAARGTHCYDGALVTEDDLAVLGSRALLTNNVLDDQGVAALDVNVITRDREANSVAWLTPGADAGGPGPASIWQLFPSAAHRAFWWLLFVGVLLALWRARRLGGVVSEPLPVVVRSAELVEGHGRLYARAGARQRAAAALRGAARSRLSQRLGLARAASAEQVAVAAAPIIGRPYGDLLALLAGPPPESDSMLVRLAHDLDQLEAGLQEGESKR